MRICGSGSIECYQNAGEKLFGTDVIDGLKDKVAKSFRQNCSCLPACTSITYDADMDRMKFDRDAVLTFVNISHSSIKKYRSSLTIFFRRPQVVTLKREEQYTYTDFMAICGGLLGLFLGISALSIVELVYYFSLRLFWTLHRFKSNIAPFGCESIGTNQVYQ